MTSPLKPLGLGSIYVICSIALWTSTKFVQMVALGSKMALRRRVLCLKIFFSRTAWLRCLKFGMLHCLVVLYQVYSNQGPRVQDGPAPGGPRFKPYKYIKKSEIFFFRTTWLRCLKSGMLHCLVNLYQVCSNEGPKN